MSELQAVHVWTKRRTKHTTVFFNRPLGVGTIFYWLDLQKAGNRIEYTAQKLPELLATIKFQKQVVQLDAPLNDIRE